MKYKTQIEVDLPQEKVAKLLIAHANYSKWQPEFVSMEPVSGNAGELGSKMRLHYKMGKREMEMLETVAEKKFPNIYATIYEAKNVWNLVRINFKKVNENKTLLEAQVEFRFKGFMRVFAFLMPRAFKKQTYKNFMNFKKFAEGA